MLALVPATASLSCCAVTSPGGPLAGWVGSKGIGFLGFWRWDRPGVCPKGPRAVKAGLERRKCLKNRVFYHLRRGRHPLPRPKTALGKSFPHSENHFPSRETHFPSRRSRPASPLLHLASCRLRFPSRRHHFPSRENHGAHSPSIESSLRCAVPDWLHNELDGLAFGTTPSLHSPHDSAAIQQGSLGGRGEADGAEPSAEVAASLRDAINHHP